MVNTSSDPNIIVYITADGINMIPYRYIDTGKKWK